MRYAGGFTTEFKFIFEFKFEYPPSTGPDITRINGAGIVGLGSASGQTGFTLSGRILFD